MEYPPSRKAESGSRAATAWVMITPGSWFHGSPISDRSVVMAPYTVGADQSGNVSGKCGAHRSWHSPSWLGVTGNITVSEEIPGLTDIALPKRRRIL
ncbi:hypothetical protein TNCV_1826921 [Trichonephila clavipes]|nr:hypothetical protein TNCV_1826921 [Trichonephila clavipes]